MSTLTPASTLTIIWSLFSILTLTILIRFYCLHIYRPSSGGIFTSSSLSTFRRPSVTGVSPGASSSRLHSRKINSNIFITTFIIALHIFTMLHCVGTTYSIKWGDERVKLYAEALRRFGESNQKEIVKFMNTGEAGALKKDLRKLGLALELGYVCVMWCVKFGFLAIWWNIGRRLWEVLDAPASPSSGTSNRLEAGSAVGTHRLKDKLKEDVDPDSAMGRAVKKTYFLLCLTGFLAVVSFLAIMIYQAVVGGIMLGRERDAGREGSESVIPASWGNAGYSEWKIVVIATAVGNLSTDLLLIIIAALLLRSLRLPPMELRGTYLLLTIAISTIAACCVRLAYIVSGLNSNSAPSSMPERGFEGKILTTLEMVLGGISICVPGLRFLVRVHSRSFSTRRPRAPTHLVIHSTAATTPCTSTAELAAVSSLEESHRGRTRPVERYPNMTQKERERRDAERFVRAVSGLPSPDEEFPPTLNNNIFGPPETTNGAPATSTRANFSMVPREVGPLETVELAAQRRTQSESRGRQSRAISINSTTPLVAGTAAIGTRAINNGNRERSRSRSQSCPRSRSLSCTRDRRGSISTAGGVSRPVTAMGDKTLPSLPPLVDREVEEATLAEAERRREKERKKLTISGPL